MRELHRSHWLLAIAAVILGAAAVASDASIGEPFVESRRLPENVGEPFVEARRLLTPVVVSQVPTAAPEVAAAVVAATSAVPQTPVPTQMISVPVGTTESPLAEAETAGSDGLKFSHRLMGLAKDFAGLFAFAMVLLIAFAFKDLWWPMIYENSCGLCRWPSILDVPCIGWCCSCICRCCCPPYHPAFRLRVVIHQAINLRSTDYLTGMESYCVVKAGYNPIKTTAIRAVPRMNGTYPVVWEEPCDLEIVPSISHVVVQVMDHDTIGDDDVVGTCEIEVSDIYSMLGSTVDGSTSHMEEQFQLLHGSRAAGHITLSFFATPSGKPLAAVMPGMDLSHSERQPLKQESMRSAW